MRSSYRREYILSFVALALLLTLLTQLHISVEIAEGSMLQKLPTLIEQASQPSSSASSGSPRHVTPSRGWRRRGPLRH